MINLLKVLKGLCKFILNVLFVIQIILVILIFLTAAYWFFDLIESTLFAFAEPIASAVTNIVKFFYDKDVMVGGTYIDSSLLLFDIFAGITVFLLTKLKYYINIVIERINFGIEDCKKKIETDFNDELKSNAESHIKSFNKAALLIKFSTRSMDVDSIWGGDAEAGVKEKIEEAQKILYASLKHITYCKFAKIDDKLAVMLDDFTKIDNVLIFVDQSIKRLKENFKAKKWILSSYVAIDCYDNKSDFQKDILPVLELLIDLQHKGDVVCLGNFNLRYNLLSNPAYEVHVKGSYEIRGRSEVYYLVKKN